MGLSNAMPAVCSAIGSNKFSEFARVSLHHQTGPANGANVYFTFDLSPRPTSDRRIVPRREPVLRAKTTPTETDLDLSDAIVLVSCVKGKLPHSAPARELYTSAWFQKARRIVEASGSPWFVLSSLYGLVAPKTKIAPYDYTLKDLGVTERRAWATKVLDKLLPEIAGQQRVVMFAGHRYREFLIGPLRRHGKTVVPILYDFTPCSTDSNSVSVGLERLQTWVAFGTGPIAAFICFSKFLKCAAIAGKVGVSFG
jgi:hypothetical protein